MSFCRFSGGEVYKDHFKPGVYVCSQCNHPLFSSQSKLAHSSPWPAFTDTISEDSVTRMMETLTAFKVPLAIRRVTKLRQEVSQRDDVAGFVFPGAVRQVWRRAGPRVCERRPAGWSLALLNIQSLAQVCPKQRRGQAVKSEVDFLLYRVNTTGRWMTWTGKRPERDVLSTEGPLTGL